MKKFIRTILPVLIIAVFVLLFTVSPFGGHEAHADFLPDFPSLKDLLLQSFAWIAFIHLTVAAWILDIAGLLLNSAVNYGILYMQKEISQISTISAAWTVFRDLGNLVFIFIILYVAVATILDLGGIDTKRVIRNIIIVGLLVNFSLFFTKVLIDASNIVTISFYNQIITPGATLKDFAASFAGPLGISSSLDGTSFVSQFAPSEGANAHNGSFITIAEVGIGGSVFFFMVAITFAFAALLIIARFIILLVLMMLSPFAFFMFILPQTKKYAEKWWNQLRNQLIFAPLFMLLLYVVAQLNKTLTLGNGTGTNIDSAGTGHNLIYSLPGVSNTAGLGTNGQSPLDLVLRFLIMIFFLNLAILLSLSAASNSGGVVSGVVNRVRNGVTSLSKKAVSKAGQKVSEKAASATSTIAGAGFRRYVGKNSYQYLKENKDKLEDRASQGGVGGWVAKQQIALHTKIAKTGGKGGYQGVVEEQVKLDKKRAKELGDKGELFKYSYKDDKGNDKYAYRSGGQMMKEARRQAKDEGITDKLAINKRAKEIYEKSADDLKRGESYSFSGGSVRTESEIRAKSERVVKARAAKEGITGDAEIKRLIEEDVANSKRGGTKLAATKLSRQEVFAEEVLRKGTWLERTNTWGDKETYQSEHTGHIEAAAELLKDAQKKKNKQELPRLKRERDQLRKDADALKRETDALQKETDEFKKTMDALRGTEEEKRELKAEYDKKLKTYNEKKEAYDKKLAEHDKKDTDVREAGGKEKDEDKKESGKDGDDKPK